MAEAEDTATVMPPTVTLFSVTVDEKRVPAMVMVVPATDNPVMVGVEADKYLK